MASLFRGNPMDTAVGQKIDDATDANLPSVDEKSIMGVCDIINESDAGPKDAIRAIRKKIQNNLGKNYNVVLFCLTVLESCVKNCGHRFHVQVANKDFLHDFVKIVGPKHDPPQSVFDKVLTLIQTWVEAFRGQPELGEMEKAYRALKDKGIKFPITDQRKSEVLNAKFLKAALVGNLSEVIEYLNGGIDINTSLAASKDMNALHLASLQGRVNVVTELLSRGANVDAPNKTGATALHLSSAHGQLEVVKILVHHNANVNFQDEKGISPLFAASSKNHFAVVQFLLQNGASPSLATKFTGHTPFTVALQQDHGKVGALLLMYDTEANVQSMLRFLKKNNTNPPKLLLENDQNDANINTKIPRETPNEQNDNRTPQHGQQLNTSVADLWSTVGISPAEDVTATKDIIADITSHGDQICENKDVHYESESGSLMAKIKDQEKIMKSLVEQIAQKIEHITSLEQTTVKQGEIIMSLDQQNAKQRENVLSLEQYVKQQNEKIKSLEVQLKKESET